MTTRRESVDHPILFLDLDGVLHPLGEIALDGNGQLARYPTLFRWRPIPETLLDPFPEVRIVVSSDWRRLFDDPSLVQLLGPLGTRFDGVVQAYGPSRMDEILTEVKHRNVTRWLALDDHLSVVNAAASDTRLIPCDAATGLSSSSVQQSLHVRS
ncbi:HAD domain-containing protein [Paraburkholderia flagellata]|uniref:HAD domain-containing protein n=1 Tax=Paraburkholderia flagellata TaxID=2883241 RepID=UPI001EE9BAAC|nr:HAD domain-containing protein [Paraburkholderia flagellata]